MLKPISISLVALYLRGLQRPVQPLRRRWVRIVSCLRGADCPFEDFPRILHTHGFHEESILLDDSSLVEAARVVYLQGRSLTSLDDCYPKRWLERLGDGAPPALWVSGTPSTKPYIGVVGTRNIDLATKAFAEGIGREAVRLGYAVISGGALGSDLAGVKGAQLAGGDAVELLPNGINQYLGIDKCGLSLSAPDEPFSTAAAMERNTLIYAASEQTVIAHSRFKQGGTWIGALEALRKKTCPLIVRDDQSQASRALIGLGCYSITDPTTLGQALSDRSNQKGLFGIG